jgi:hypothetical protein
MCSRPLFPFIGDGRSPYLCDRAEAQPAPGKERYDAFIGYAMYTDDGGDFGNILFPEEVYDTERHLLYVACTRARDHLLITSVEPASEFLDDLRM